MCVCVCVCVCVYVCICVLGGEVEGRERATGNCTVGGYYAKIEGVLPSCSVWYIDSFMRVIITNVLPHFQTTKYEHFPSQTYTIEGFLVFYFSHTRKFCLPYLPPCFRFRHRLRFRHCPSHSLPRLRPYPSRTDPLSSSSSSSSSSFTTLSLNIPTFILLHL